MENIDEPTLNYVGFPEFFPCKYISLYRSLKLDQDKKSRIWILLLLNVLHLELSVWRSLGSFEESENPTKKKFISELALIVIIEYMCILHFNF